MKKFAKILSLSWFVLSLLGVFPGLASANGNLTIVVKNPNPYTGNQSWYTYEKKPGETVDDIASVKNLSNKPVKAHVYAVDATSNDSGSFILKLENENKNDVGKWTKINAEDIVTIPPQQSMDFPFHIKVPDTASPGQYFGGLVLEEITDKADIYGVEATSSNGKTICCTNILVKTRIGLRIYLTVPGAIKDGIEWSGFKTVEKNKNTSFQFEIKNTGNVALEPTATVEIFDNMGNQIDRFQKNLGDSLPGTTMNPTIAWDHQPLVGSFKAVGKITYSIKSQSLKAKELHGSADTIEKSITFSVFPLEKFMIIALFLVAIGITYWVYEFNRHSVKMNWETYQVQPTDNIIEIAELHNINWQKLARINKIKPPYLLKTGEKIHVPKNSSKHQQSLFDDKKHE